MYILVFCRLKSGRRRVRLSGGSTSSGGGPRVDSPQSIPSPVRNKRIVRLSLFITDLKWVIIALINKSLTISYLTYCSLYLNWRHNSHFDIQFSINLVFLVLYLYIYWVLLHCEPYFLNHLTFLSHPSQNKSNMYFSSIRGVYGKEKPVKTEWLKAKRGHKYVF